MSDTLQVPTKNKAPTIHDVAAALNIHKSTVSLALSGKGNVSERLRQRVIAKAHELGYEPHPLAQRLANGVNNSLICLCSAGLDVGLGTEKILLLQRKLRQLSPEVPIYIISDLEENNTQQQVSQVRQLCRQQPRAIVCAAQNLNPLTLPEIESYQQDGGVVVTYDLPISLQCDQVVFDREDNAYQTARYLIEHGHKRIGIGVSNVRGPQGEIRLTQNLRLQGFNRALSEAGLPLREDWIFECSTYEIGGAEMAAHFLATKDRPTALCIVNDYVAFSFMVEVTRAGVRVPEDLSIIGHDNQPVAAYCPVPLTSATHPIEGIAQAVIELLDERLKSSDAPLRTINLRSDLIQRGSVARR